VSRLAVPFELRGVAGAVHVELVRNEDPVGWGCDLLTSELPADAASGFPVCTARVEHPSRGYAAVMGWVQLVQSSDSEDDPTVFEIDPTTIYRDVPTPYAWFGIKPTLFDAPFRPSRYPLSWRARSYLCYTPDAVMSRVAEPLCSFSWGFDVDGDGAIELTEPAALDSASWSEHLEMLRDRYPGWELRPAAGQ
jgi:hypothetical protein